MGKTEGKVHGEATNHNPLFSGEIATFTKKRRREGKGNRKKIRRGLHIKKTLTYHRHKSDGKPGSGGNMERGGQKPGTAGKKVVATSIGNPGQGGGRSARLEGGGFRKGEEKGVMLGCRQPAIFPRGKTVFTKIETDKKKKNKKSPQVPELDIGGGGSVEKTLGAINHWTIMKNQRAPKNLWGGRFTEKKVGAQPERPEGGGGKKKRGGKAAPGDTAKGWFLESLQTGPFKKAKKSKALEPGVDGNRAMI